MKKKLQFIPIIYRDWSVAYCETGRMMVMNEFYKQFHWRFTDVCYEWDGTKVTIYRDKEEQANGMGKLIIKMIDRDKKFMTALNKSALKEVNNLQKHFIKLLKSDFSRLSGQKLHTEFNKYVEEMSEIGPKILVTQYFPLQFENSNQKDVYEKDINLCIETRSKWDKIVAPLGDELAIKFGENAAQRLDVKKEFSRFLTISDIKKIFENKVKKHILEKELEKRSSYFLLAGGTISDIPLKEYLQSKGWDLAEQETNSEIKGASTFKSGRVIRGIVKIIQNKREINKINEGDILVTPAVTPEYAPIYKKILAIITDEGGITSHAAIVSRELKIPCIVGTKTATKLLKDGDLVEVDADNGVVRVLEKTKS